MRFLFLAYRDAKNPFAVGGDYYLWELAKGAATAGNKVTFVCSAFEGSKQREFIDGVELFRLSNSRDLPLLLFKEYVGRWRGQFDIVVEEAIGGQRLPFLAASYVSEPLIAVWHQRHYKIFREQYPFPVWCVLTVLEFALARMYRNQRILTPSKGAKKELLRLGFNIDRVSVVYDGVGEIFRTNKINEQRENTIVCLGKLRRYKRFDHAILSLERVRAQSGRSVKLIIAGKMSEIDKGCVESLQRLAEELGVQNCVEFRFNVSESGKLNLLENARLLVQPSPVEGFSIAVAEANSCGTPVVVSDGTPSDVVVTGYNGLVYKYGDIEGLADATAALLLNDSLWRQMSRNAWKFSKQFSWDNSVREFLEISKHLYAEHGIVN